MGHRNSIKYWASNNQRHLGVRVPNQPVVELYGLDKVCHGDPLVEPMEPLGIALGDEGRGEPGGVRRGLAGPPVHLVHQVQVVLGVRVGYEGSWRHVALGEHLGQGRVGGGTCRAEAATTWKAITSLE